jgi:hypothetical protein
MSDDDETPSGSGAGALDERQRTGFDATALNSQAALQQPLDFTVGTAKATALTATLWQMVLAVSDADLMGFDGMRPEAVKLIDRLTKEIGERRVTEPQVLLMGARAGLLTQRR